MDYLLRIATVKASFGLTSEDMLCWKLNVNGQFQVCSAYSACMGVQFGPIDPMWKAIAGFQGIPLEVKGDNLAKGITSVAGMCGAGCERRKWCFIDWADFEKLSSLVQATAWML
ncbi:hypothetical protein V6N12_057016 [Hibiscus sabdariffa]|uniref:Uncharacterized protein n=1 Tax=Hibiscus sabdariffa TaxID=183260 RepID=A0ABR2DCS1_9ROSI